MSDVVKVEVLERVIIQGDLAKLSPEDKVRYYAEVCNSLGLNPATRPFEYITLSGRLVLYARKDCTEQLRRLHNVSITITARERLDGIYAVTARAVLPSGRTDEAIGAVSIEGLKGDALANALMKAETKSKRRVTLSICGLGMLDETEVETIESSVTPAPAQPAPSRPALPHTEKPQASASAPSPGAVLSDWLDKQGAAAEKAGVCSAVELRAQVVREVGASGPMVAWSQTQCDRAYPIARTYAAFCKTRKEAEAMQAEPEAVEEYGQKQIEELGILLGQAGIKWADACKRYNLPAKQNLEKLTVEQYRTVRAALLTELEPQAVA